jgi:hypothetical protein
MIPRHPWIASLLPQVGLAHLGPNQMRMAVLFEAAGFTGREVCQAWYTVIAYVLGVATSEAAWLTTLARAGGSEQAWVARLYPAAEEAAQPYPRLREQYGHRRDLDPGQAREEDFGYGLERLLDGWRPASSAEPPASRPRYSPQTAPASTGPGSP